MAVSRVLVIDNYDSFTYNLVQYLGELGAEVEAVRNDAASVDDLLGRTWDRVVVSPGPCTPNEAGISVDTMRRFPEAGVPTLGVCLGHQSLAQAFGGRIVRAPRVMHGKTSKMFHDERGVYAGVENPFVATRYHSLVIAPDSLPAELEVTAKTWEDEIMGVRHRGFAGTRAPIEGVQFHPESIMTKEGLWILDNFLAVSRRTVP